MATGIFAVDLDLVCFRKNLFVTIGGDIPEHDLVALLDLVAEQVVIFQRSAPHVSERGLPADDFLHRIGNEFGVLLELCPFFGKLAQAKDHTRHGVAGGVVAADDQQHQIAHEFHRIHIAHMFRVDHHRDQVWRWFCIDPFVPQLGEIGAHFI